MSLFCPRAVLAFTLSLGACAGDDNGSTGSTGQSSQTGDSGSLTCEPAGGTCQCAGTCGSGSSPAPMLTCPQPPDSSGACSLECCLPDDASTSVTTTAATTAATAMTTGSACVCADLPMCTTPDNEDCGGMYPTGQCCDAGAQPFHCACIEPCTGGYPCCVLASGCDE